MGWEDRSLPGCDTLPAQALWQQGRSAEPGDRRIEQIAKEVHSEVALLKQVKGVGTLIAPRYVLTSDEPHRSRRSAMDMGTDCATS